MIESMLNQTVAIYPRTGFDEEGQSVFGAGECVKCRMESTNIRTMVTDGQEFNPSFKFFFSADTQIGIGDKITKGSAELYVRMISKIVLGSGTVHHIEVIV